MAGSVSDLERGLVEMIAVNQLALSEKSLTPGLRRLVKAVLPKTELPSVEHLRDVVVPFLSGQLTEKVEAILSSCDVFSISCSFLSNNQRSEPNCPIVFTAHCLKDFHRSAVVLQVKDTRKEIVLEQMAKRRQAGGRKMLVVISQDLFSGPFCNMKPYYGFPCFVLKFKQIFDTSFMNYGMQQNTHLKMLNLLNDMCNKLKRYQANPEKKQLLIEAHEKHKVPMRLIPVDIAVQSMDKLTYLMDYFLPRRAVLSEIPDIDHFSDSEWEYFLQLKALMTVAERILEKLSQSTATLSDVIPQAKYLLRFLTKVEPKFTLVKEVIGKLRCKVDKLLNFCLEEEVFSVATFLDPRYKKSLFSDHPTLESIVQRYILWSNGEKDKHNDRVDQSFYQAADSFNFEQFLNDLPRTEQTKCKEDTSQESSSPSTPTEALDKNLSQEIGKYLALPIIPNNADVFLWWKNNCSQFPKLSSVAKVLLSCPPWSSKNYEEKNWALMGRGGMIVPSFGVSPEEKLNNEAVEKLNFIGQNIHLLDASL